jgi:hypothetical protein
LIQHADDDGNIPVSASHHGMPYRKQNKKVFAVANLAHPNFDYTIINPNSK